MIKFHTDSGVVETAFTILGVIISTVLGDWIPLMTTLLILNGSDIITGFLKGGVNKDVGSRVFYNGIKKKIGQWFLIIVANALDEMIFSQSPIAKMGLISFLVATEGISITENLAEIGVPIPAFITKYLSQVRDKNDDRSLEQKG